MTGSTSSETAGAAPVPAQGDGHTVERALCADPHDFAGLYIRHRSSLVLHARRYTDNSQDADEVVQEAFLRLFLALPELETELQALAYSRRTVTNLCIDRFRAQSRRPRLVALESVLVDELADDDPGDPVVRAEDAAMVREALSLLSPLHRAALVKREIEEKSLPEIAAELDIPEETVKHVLFRARRALRRLLEGTSLVPGGDVEFGKALGKLAAVGPGGMAVLFVALVLGLGSGPNLRAIPVVGTDLPDLIRVTDIARTVGTVVTDAAAYVGGRSPASGPAPAELPADKTAAVADAPASLRGAGETATVLPAPDPTSIAPPSPAPVPTPTAASPEPVASEVPVLPAPAASTSPSPLPSTSPTTSPTTAPTTAPGESVPRTVAPAPTAEPAPSGPVPSGPAPTATSEPAPVLDSSARSGVPVVTWTS